MRVTTIHGPRDIRLEERPVPTIEAPTDAIVKVTAGCICGSDLWPYRGENDITPGDTIGHEMIGVVEEVGSRGHLVPARRLRGRAVLPLRQHLPELPRRRAPRPASTSASPPGDRGSTPRSPRPRAAWCSTHREDGMPDAALLPSLLTLSDVFPTGWHCAVAAGVQPGDTVVVVGDGAVGLCAVLAAVELGAERVIAMSRHDAAPGDRPPVRRHPHRGGARQGGRRADQGAHRRCRRRRRARVRRHRRLDAAGLRRVPVPVRRSASSASRTASSCRCAGCSARTSGSPAGWLPCAATCPSCSSWSPPATVDPGPRLRHAAAARRGRRGLPRDGRAAPPSRSTSRSDA